MARKPSQKKPGREAAKRASARASRKAGRAPKRAAPERRQQILESAGAVFAKASYARVGTADLARAAGVSEPALYRYFSGKRELYVETLKAMGARLLDIWRGVAAGSDDPLEAIRAIGLGYYDHLQSRAPVLRLFYEAISEIDDAEIRRTVRESFRAMVGFVEGLVREGRARGRVHPEVDPRIAAWHFMAIGLSFDLVHMLGLGAELDREKVESWGSLYLGSLASGPEEE
ncbi:MAG: TetR/AcrR family transcriptional regulator [Deltaproteobacteria bacterium]|nr:TetR/AcrR family transcriptional regulator [Deltaproteobacteria bacterium]